MPSTAPGKPATLHQPGFQGPQSIVTINISRDKRKQTFLVHKQFICFYSPYFRAALDGPFREGGTQILELEDVFPSIFAMFVNWLYTQQIALDGRQFPSLFSLLRLWVLADMVLVPKLQNEILRQVEMRRPENIPFSPQTIASFYEQTGTRSPLRRYLAAWCSTSIRHEISLADGYPQELLIDIFNWRTNRTRYFPQVFNDVELKQFFVPEPADDEFDP